MISRFEKGRFPMKKTTWFIFAALLCSAAYGCADRSEAPPRDDEARSTDDGAPTANAPGLEETMRKDGCCRCIQNDVHGCIDWECGADEPGCTDEPPPP
jgi:hypothetical protein